MFAFLRTLAQARPRPFLRLQQFFGIQEEWKTFKSLIGGHKFKLLALGAFATYPLYKPYLNYYYSLFNIQLQAQFQNGKPVPNALESFGKQIVENILRDPQMKREGAVFVEDLAKKDIVLEGIVTLLVKSASDPHFIKEAKVFAKYLTHELLQDQVIEEDAIELVITLLRDPEVKNEALELVKWLCQQESSRKELVDLCRDCFQQPRMQVAVKEMLAHAMYEVLMDRETVEKLKSFSTNLIGDELGKTGKEKGNVKGLIDLIVNKMVKSYHKGESKDGEFKKVLQGERVENELDKKKNEKAGGNEEKKFFFF